MGRWVTELSWCHGESARTYGNHGGYSWPAPHPSILPALKAFTLWLVVWTLLFYFFWGPGEPSLPCPSPMTSSPPGPLKPLHRSVSAPKLSLVAEAGLSVLCLGLWVGWVTAAVSPHNADTGGPILPRLPIPPAWPTVTLMPCGTGSACFCSLWSFLSQGLRVLCAGLTVLTTDRPLCPPALAFQDQGQLPLGSGRNAWDLCSMMVQCGVHMAHCKQSDRSRF